MKTVFVFFILTIFIMSKVSGHSLKFFKTCPKVDPIESFDVDQFMGAWYIIEVFGGMNECMTMTFTKKSETEIELTQQREFFILNELNLDHTNKYTGIITIKDTSNPGDMKVKWPANIIGNADFKIVDTDYSSYALIHECQYLWFASRMSFAILSRKNSLDEETLITLRQRISDTGTNASPLRKVNHSSCATESNATFTGTIDENFFSLLNEEQISKINSADDFLNEIGWEEGEANRKNQTAQ